MNLHEYQAKSLLTLYGVPVPKGTIADSVDSVCSAAQQLGGQCVVKAQIHAGGRGKANGVKVVNSATEAKKLAVSLLGKSLVTYQNSPDGQPVHQLLIEETLPIARELYLSILVDRALERVVVVCSSAGGMDIEEIASTQPEKILTEICDPLNGLVDFQARNLAFKLGLSQVAEFTKILKACYKLFKENDLALLEINPLVVTTDARLIALDCKVSVDDNALYRQKNLNSQRDWSQTDSKEADAHAANLNYIALNGNIGCMVNGAGLAMATMDLIKLHGGSPANFLDVGGGATAEMVTKAFKIILADSQVRAILVNIFGGIMRCDIIAEGIMTAVKEVGMQIPVIVRLEGTNVELGKRMLRESGLNIISADNLTDAAKQAVASVGGA